MKKMKFYQIVIPDNYVSMRYHEESIKSFEPVSDIIEIVPWEAITPNHPDFEEHESRYNWQHSLSADSMHKSKDFEKPHSPTERAGNCSHWELTRLRSLTDEKFFITEHDCYFKHQYEEQFRWALQFLEERDLEYMNLGLYMGCYYKSRNFATVSYDLLANNGFPINCGPWLTSERLLKTYLTGSAHNESFMKSEKYKNSDITFVTGYACNERLTMGKDNKDVIEKMGHAASRYIREMTHPWWQVPTTQMMSRSFGANSVTQHHQAYNEKYINEPWKREGPFHFID